MLVKKERLLELIQTREGSVRDACIIALENFFQDTEGVAEIILNIVEKEGMEENLFLLSKLDSFLPSDIDIQRMLKILDSIEIEDDEDEGLLLADEIIESIRNFPLSTLERNLEVLTANENFVDLSKQIEEEKKIKSYNPELLWKELEKLAEENKDKDFEEEDAIHAHLCLKTLSSYPDFVQKKFQSLFKKDDLNYYLEGFLIELAGKCRLKETCSDIFSVLLETDPMDLIHDVCIESLIQIGGKELIDLIAENFDVDPEMKISLASIPGYIPYKYSEDALLSLLEKEEDVEIKTFIAGSLLGIFSKQSVEPICKMIRERNYDPSICQLFEDLQPILEYHNMSLSDYENLKQIAEGFENGELA
ncbi:MAG: hypothetical protein H7A25_00955 [Leptospiraceae bacterium]|nr:hypothetical protein [Leptospiraceae bacterium]MCP5498444.1 hypothetical protein [Leptospiraceae bacterium]